MMQLAAILTYFFVLTCVAQFNLVASLVIWLLTLFPLAAYLAAITQARRNSEMKTEIPPLDLG